MENTSAVYTLWRTLMRLVSEASFPAVAENNEGVTVYFGDPDLAPNDVPMTMERVVVVSAINQPDASWAAIGRYARNENFVAYLYAATLIPGRTALQAAARLEEITAVLEQIVRDINAGRRPGTTPPEFDPYPVWFVEVDGPGVNPLIQTTPQGALGNAEIGLRCSFRIGTPPVEQE